jgi:glycosyltransferase involved in cell wall biosynthesis
MSMSTPSAPRPRRGPAIALVSTYPPTQCGLATFTAALAEQLGGARVVQVLDQPERPAAPEVVATLLNGSPASTAAAVRRLNGFDVVVLQHEYGIYGGPDGEDVLDLVEGLRVPLIVVLHTVLERPSDRQRAILLRLLDAADAVVTMTTTARDRVVAGYGAEPGQVAVIAHGAVDHGRLGTARTPRDRPTILTWGLLGPGKGIEWALDALAELRDLDPRYVVLGKTHPKVLEREGEAYRDGLLNRAARLGITDLVDLDARYVTVPQLADAVADVDVVLLPYDSRDQVTSGVLIEAVAAGRPVVSTAFPHAVELLGDGTGLVVPQADPAALAAALRRVLSEPGLADSMARKAAIKAPSLLWSAVAGEYLELARLLVSSALTEAS